jgi:hypothetical protein
MLISAIPTAGLCLISDNSCTSFKNSRKLDKLSPISASQSTIPRRFTQSPSNERHFHAFSDFPKCFITLRIVTMGNFFHHQHPIYILHGTSDISALNNEAKDVRPPSLPPALKAKLPTIHALSHRGKPQLFGILRTKFTLS